MEYLLFICTDTEPDPGGELPGEVDAWVEEGTRTGKRKFGDALRPISDATTLRIRNGETLLTDGPFAETKEWIAGIDVLDCKDLDEAIDYASRHPMARFGRIEIRPFMVWDD